MDTERYIKLLYEPDELLSLVVLDGGKQWGKTAIGFFYDREKFFSATAMLNGTGNVYINLNRLHHDIYGRAADRIQPYARQRFSSEEITWRPRLCVDLDPVRFSGINSTDDELVAAIDLGEEIADYISTNWGDEVVTVNSGNGVQLVFKINEEVASPLVADFLAHLDEKFTSSRVKVDTSLSDPARIVRLPGTLNCKGDDVEGRPRRMAHIMEKEHVALPKHF